MQTGAVMPREKTDPLGAFIADGFVDCGVRPAPLLSTAFDVAIASGVASVHTRRVFRNDEAGSVEATITFPVPVHAVLYELRTTIDGRVLKAHAERKGTARQSYEDGIGRGQTAVLHEEVLRGVHMLSVGHLAPGTEIVIEATWATTLSQSGGIGRMRIPLTVGDIYGRPALPDCDDLVHGGPIGHGALSVRCDSGSVALRAGDLVDGHARVPLGAPIDLEVRGAEVVDLHGLAADGRGVVLRVEPLPVPKAPLDVAIVVDRSGSMGAPCDSNVPDMTKHEAIIHGLCMLAEQIGDADRIDLWQFDDRLCHIGTTPENAMHEKATHDRSAIPLAGQIQAAAPPSNADRNARGLRRLIGNLDAPAGGTEIGNALEGVLGGTTARDVLVITDGKSHSLDIQDLAARRRRIALLLVGEDSLEANVGHLAALTGGDITVAAATDIAEALMTALDSLRTPHEDTAIAADTVEALSVTRGGAKVGAVWHTPTSIAVDELIGPAIAAIAAGLALPSLDDNAAARLAQAEGLVSHLTSLVLVDEAGKVQEGLPATRKIALPTPTASIVCDAMEGAPMPEELYEDVEDSGAECFRRGKVGADTLKTGRNDPDKDILSLLPHADEDARRFYRDAIMAIAGAGIMIDWETDPNRLACGDLAALDPATAAHIREFALQPAVIAFAHHLRINAIVLAIALLAQRDAAGNRSAARIARQALAGVRTFGAGDAAVAMS